METETAHTLEKVKRVRNVGDRDGLRQPATYVLSKREEDYISQDISAIDKAFAPENRPFLNQLSDIARGQLLRYRRYLEKKLESQSARAFDISKPQTRDALAKRERELAEQIREGMPPAEVMRRNPAGAVDWHMKWERQNKDRILEWKNIRRLLHYGDDSKDLTNVEMLRPSMYQQGGPNTHMVGAQIQGFESYSHIPDDLWKETFGHLHAVNSPLAVAERREQEEAAHEPTGGLDQNAQGSDVALKEAEIEQLKAQLEAVKRELASREEKREMAKKARQLAAQKAREAARRKREATSQGA